ncbi:MAG TPA: DUF2723 domain-containing protein [Gemmatimonadaceae bacterium]|nr:DUF2723 domain-containing protein [Gemmatimonadaceae bacterium]
MATSKAAPVDYRPSYLAAAIAAAAVFALYIYTLAPSTAMWDTSEYIAAAYTLGLPHPPGNPFFVLVGRVFSILPIAPNVAMRINVLAALCSAVTAGVWFLIAERVLVGWFPERWQRIAGGALASLIGATAFTVWAQSVVNEKVYTVSLVGLAIVAWLVVRWCDEPDAPGADKFIILACYLMGLGYANHMAGMLTLPAMGVAIMLRRPKTLIRWRLILACVGAGALGLSPFATQPIRAAHFPGVNEGEPTGCRDKIALSCTLSKQTYTSFMYNFNRGQYAKPGLNERQAPFSAQLGMWWYYFKWQWLRDPHGTNGQLQGALAMIFLALGFLGAWVHWQRDKASFAFFGPLMLTVTLVLIYYLNFKYGNTQPAGPEVTDEMREVRDRDYFFLWSFSAWSVWAALGLMYLWESIAALLGTEEAKVGSTVVAIPKRTNWLVAAPVLVLAFIPLFGNFTSASRRGETDAADFAKDMLNSVEPYGILVAVGDNDTFPLWYAQEVEGVRRDVLIANTSLMNTDWFVRQMIRRPIETYDEATGPAVYRGKKWVKPTHPPLSMTYDEADAMPLYSPLNEPMQFVTGDVKAVVDPRVLPITGVLQKADLLVYQLIKDNPDRPVHFARSSGRYANELGFGDYMVMTGLTRFLSREPVKESNDIKRIEGELGWVDVTTTKALWDDFVGPPALIKKNKWIDKPSIGIPFLYVTAGLSLSEGLLMRGDSLGAEKVMGRVKGISSAVRMSDVVQGALPQLSTPIPIDSPQKVSVPTKVPEKAPAKTPPPTKGRQ